MEKKIIYIDLDNTMADYLTAAKERGISPSEAKRIPGFFESLKPIPGAIEAYNELNKYFEVYILSTAPWSNPFSLVEKMNWVKKYLPCAKTSQNIGKKFTKIAGNNSKSRLKLLIKGK